VEDAIARPGQRWGDPTRTITYLTRDHAMFGRAARSLKNPPPDTALGLLVVETLRRHSDALSVSGGLYLHSTDTHAPHTEAVLVLPRDDGTPDLDHLCRTGGKAERVTRVFC